jgi:serine/threonine protein kinase
MLVKKQLIDNYDIISPLGGGGGSNIYKALSKKTRSFVCLKQIFFDTESKKKHILREIDSMRKLNYLTNSIDFYEVISDKYYYYIIMELCDTSLRKLIEQKKGLEIPKIKVILNQLNKVFQKMKSLNMIHRDIKPENILIKYLDDKKKNISYKTFRFWFVSRIKSLRKSKHKRRNSRIYGPRIRYDQRLLLRRKSRYMVFGGNHI